jgi:hypothetical protein
MTRTVRALIVTGLVVFTVPAQNATARSTPTADIVVSGLGGQEAVLGVPSPGLDIDFGRHPTGYSRVFGSDGSVGGIIVQRAAGGAVVVGLLTQNLPGSPRAIGIALTGASGSHVPPGTYRLTLLGNGPQEARLPVRGAVTRTVHASGRAVPITRDLALTRASPDAWADQIGAVRSGDSVLVSVASSAGAAVPGTNRMCLLLMPPLRPCETGSALADAAGWKWSATLFPPGQLSAGSYMYVGAGVAGEATGSVLHTSVIVSPRP